MIPRKTRRLLKNYLQAEVDLSWIGNTDPEEQEKVKTLHKKARIAFEQHLLMLETEYADLMKKRFPC